MSPDVEGCGSEGPTRVGVPGLGRVVTNLSVKSKECYEKLLTVGRKCVDGFLNLLSLGFVAGL